MQRYTIQDLEKHQHGKLPRITEVLQSLRSGGDLIDPADVEDGIGTVPRWWSWTPWRGDGIEQYGRKFFMAAVGGWFLVFPMFIS